MPAKRGGKAKKAVKDKRLHLPGSAGPVYSQAVAPLKVAHQSWWKKGLFAYIILLHYSFWFVHCHANAGGRSAKREQSSPYNHCKSAVRKRKFLVCSVDTIEMLCHLSERVYYGYAWRLAFWIFLGRHWNEALEWQSFLDIRNYSLPKQILLVLIRVMVW